MNSFQLSFDGVRVSAVDVITEGVNNNTFLTFWQQNDIDLSRGLDFQPRGSVYARLTHLQHAPFTYRIRVSLLSDYFNTVKLVPNLATGAVTSSKTIDSD